ncbi:zinc knuckle transcription factor [Colletotrichum karsti]|uniref:Zinc knuckle transcription factor n=1 Tax=Colletotrichum karsti TaxID=1095194 RepID=A0A9P6IHF9_9PEZI|nr:zinc knuckle transcription factor [Colletotrichum karsti]KAF9882341.1 zinc knuckle transcription factor [Colletotrichum karsti]
MGSNFSDQSSPTPTSTTNKMSGWGATGDDAWGTNDASGNTGAGDDPWNNPQGGDGGEGGGERGACFNCGQDGHSKAECPEPPKPFEGTCNACGQEGHRRRDCPDAPAMTCRVCGQEGHMRKDCPDKPPEVCRNCHEEGHAVVECKNPRKIDLSMVEDVEADQAWNEIIEAASERDGVEAKEAVLKYIKHFPEMTYTDLEEAFRGQEMGVYLIATERALAPTHTNMDLQGNLEKKYTIQYRFNPNPERAREKESWPPSPQENMARLKDAGEPVSRLMQKCNNCDELGHTSKACPQEANEKVRVTITCYNCGEEGHRVRDCPTPRVDKFACKNCGQSGHKVSDCTEPRSAEGVECNKCHETGHFSRDCPTGGGGGRSCHNCGQEGHISKECTEPRKIKCRNCDEEGHTSRDCDKPVDVTRIKCMNCGEMGHKKYQCPNPPTEDVDNFGPSNGGGGGGDSGDAWGSGGGGGGGDAAQDTGGW